MREARSQPCLVLELLPDVGWGGLVHLCVSVGRLGLGLELGLGLRRLVHLFDRLSQWVARFDSGTVRTERLDSDPLPP